MRDLDASMRLPAVLDSTEGASTSSRRDGSTSGTASEPQRSRQRAGDRCGGDGSDGGGGGGEDPSAEGCDDEEEEEEEAEGGTEPDSGSDGLMQAENAEEVAAAQTPGPRGDATAVLRVRIPSTCRALLAKWPIWSA